MADKAREAYEKTLKENEQYPLRSLTTDQRVRYEQSQTKPSKKAKAKAK